MINAASVPAEIECHPEAVRRGSEKRLVLPALYLKVTCDGWGVKRPVWRRSPSAAR
ncbi:hypothetical protein ABIE62_000757 [Porphyrobacter sp. MBR-155]|jgi:hypothetical protein